MYWTKSKQLKTKKRAISLKFILPISIQQVSSTQSDQIITYCILANKKFTNKKQVSARSLLEYVCWLADAEKIYEVSLGTYDLELVAMSAEFTHKDPKEYVPYLEKLKAITDLIERKYLINTHMKKYDRAVEVLAEGTEE